MGNSWRRTASNKALYIDKFNFISMPFKANGGSAAGLTSKNVVEIEEVSIWKVKQSLRY